MLDNDDADWMLFLIPNHPVGFALWLVLFIGVVCAVSINEQECSAMRCERGIPALMNNQCLCITPATKPNDMPAPNF